MSEYDLNSTSNFATPSPATNAEAAAEYLGSRPSQIQDRVESYTRENPTRVVLGAVAVGFLLGRMLIR